jgi:selenide,water dikinase
LPADLPTWQRDLLTDPQTSGGLLVACAADRAEAIERSIVAAGYPRARIVGSVSAGAPVVRIS